MNIPLKKLVLSDSVGMGGHNNRNDVKALQQCLNDLQDSFRLSSKLAVDGSLGRTPENSATVAAIKGFQAQVVGMAHPDGRIDQGGRSHKALNDCLNELMVSEAASRGSTVAAISTAGIQLLQSVETLATVPYDDQTGRTIQEWCAGATIGYGHLIARHEWSSCRRGVSPDEAEALFFRDIEPFIEVVKNSVITPLKQHEFDALVIFAFNIGVSGFASSSAVAMINNPEVDTPYESLEAAWKAWNKSQGQIMEGLIKRRACEWNIYSRGLYDTW